MDVRVSKLTKHPEKAGIYHAGLNFKEGAKDRPTQDGLIFIDGEAPFLKIRLIVNISTNKVVTEDELDHIIIDHEVYTEKPQS